jgi:hypothetical protein
MTHARQARFYLLTLAAVAGHAWAQPAAVMDAAGTPLPRYHVEVIVFAHSDGDLTEEWFAHTRDKARRDAQSAAALPIPRIVGSPSEAADGRAIVLDALSLDELTWVEPDAEAAIDPLAPNLQAPADFANEAIEPNAEAAQDDARDELNVAVKYRAPDNAGLKSFRFRLLRDDELQLNAAYNRIVSLDAYQPLLHSGWVQEGLAEDQAHPMDLSYLGTLNPRGTIQLHLSRFLHVTLNMDFQPAAAVSATPGFTDNPFELSEVPLQTRYLLVDQRRVRSGELHYIDHPLFGVLVLVTPAPQAEETADPNASEQTPAA